MLPPLFAPEDTLAAGAARPPSTPAHDQESEIEDGELDQGNIARPESRLRKIAHDAFSPVSPVLTHSAPLSKAAWAAAGSSVLRWLTIGPAAFGHR